MEFFFLIILTLYLIESLLLMWVNFGQGIITLPNWFMWVFCGWIMAIYCILNLLIKKMLDE